MKAIRTTDSRFVLRAVLLILLIAILTVTSTRMRADTATCSGGSVTLPFTDVPAANVFFCSIAAAFYSGLTNGTSATTYNPSDVVTREQMAAFVSRTLEQSIRRNNLRAVTKKWYLPPGPAGIALTTVGTNPESVEFDGTDIWVASSVSDTVQRFRTNDGQILQTFTAANGVHRLVTVLGRIFAIGNTSPGQLYSINPLPGSAPVSVELSNLPANPFGIAFDGLRVWTANHSGSVSKITLDPAAATNVTAGFSSPYGILFDGDNIWVTDDGPHHLLKLDPNGGVLKTIVVGSGARHPVFDGLNIWVPNQTSDSVTVVRVKDSQGDPLTEPFVLTTLTGNGLDNPYAIAFDGERMLVTNSSTNNVSLFKAADLSPLGSISTGAGTLPRGACSDGMNFWVTFFGTDKLARF